MKIYKAEIVGIREVAYQRKDGQQVAGQDIYFSISGVPDLEGFLCSNVFHSFRDSSVRYSLGDVINIAYDRYSSSPVHRFSLVE